MTAKPNPFGSRGVGELGESFSPLKRNEVKCCVCVEVCKALPQLPYSPTFGRPRRAGVPEVTANHPGKRHSPYCRKFPAAPG